MVPGDSRGTAGLPLSKAPNPEMLNVVLVAEEGGWPPSIEGSLLVHVFIVSVSQPGLPVYLDKHRLCSLSTWFVFKVLLH